MPDATSNTIGSRSGGEIGMRAGHHDLVPGPARRDPGAGRSPHRGQDGTTGQHHPVGLDQAGARLHAGLIETDRVVLTGGPVLAAVGQPAGGSRRAGSGAGSRGDRAAPDFAPEPELPDGVRRGVRGVLAAL